MWGAWQPKPVVRLQSPRTVEWWPTSAIAIAPACSETMATPISHGKVGSQLAHDLSMTCDEIQCLLHVCFSPLIAKSSPSNRFLLHRFYGILSQMVALLFFTLFFNLSSASLIQGGVLNSHCTKPSMGNLVFCDLFALVLESPKLAFNSANC